MSGPDHDNDHDHQNDHDNDPPHSQSPSQPGAVLFDFDGVLADTENLHIVAWERVFQAVGLVIPPRTVARSVEIDDRTFIRDVFLQHGVPEQDYEPWIERKQAAVRELFERCPVLYPGVDLLIPALRKHGIPLAVVSSSCRENVETVLRRHHLRSSFETLVCWEDAPRGKPDPLAYQVALSRLQTPAAASVALEDSPTGLQAARAAGIPVIAVGQRRPQGDWSLDAHFLLGFHNPDHALNLILRILQPS